MHYVNIKMFPLLYTLLDYINKPLLLDLLNATADSQRYMVLEMMNGCNEKEILMDLLNITNSLIKQQLDFEYYTIIDFNDLGVVIEEMPFKEIL